MGSADLLEAAATRQQNWYTVLQQCTVFVYRHAYLRSNLFAKGIPAFIIKIPNWFLRSN
jgi:hypothetical protein